MTTSEKVAYLKGLCEGMGIDETNGNGKLFKVITDILEDLALDLADTKDSVQDLIDTVGEIGEDLSGLEDEFYECSCGDCDECDGCCGDEDEDDEDDEDEDEDDEDDEDAFYSVECPGCGFQLTVDEDTLGRGSFECPECSKLIEFGRLYVEKVGFEDDEED